MKRKPTAAERGVERPPKLLPVGSVNRVLLLGGKNLTMFQSFGLMFIGVCVAGTGGSFLVGEFRSGAGEHLDAIYFLLAFSLLFTWGLIMFFNGVRGVVRRLRFKQTTH
jgi:hypothetical protein